MDKDVYGFKQREKLIRGLEQLGEKKLPCSSQHYLKYTCKSLNSPLPGFFFVSKWGGLKRGKSAGENYAVSMELRDSILALGDPEKKYTGYVICEKCQLTVTHKPIGEVACPKCSTEKISIEYEKG